MTIATSDKYIYLPLSNGTIAIPYEKPSIGDSYINLPDGCGGFIAHKYTPPAEGDYFAYIPLSDGRTISLKIAGGAAPLSNPLNIQVITYPDTTNQHHWKVSWDDQTGFYDKVWIEYSIAGFSSNEGDGTKIGEFGAGTNQTSTHVHTIAPACMHYFTGWGVTSSTPDPASISYAQLLDVSPRAVYTFGDYSQSSDGLSRPGRYTITYGPGTTGSVTGGLGSYTVNWNNATSTQTTPYIISFGFQTDSNRWANGVSWNLSRSATGVKIYGMTASYRPWSSETLKSTGWYYSTDITDKGYSVTYTSQSDILNIGLGVCQASSAGSYSVTVSGITFTT